MRAHAGNRRVRRHAKLIGDRRRANLAICKTSHPTVIREIDITDSVEFRAYATSQVILQTKGMSTSRSDVRRLMVEIVGAFRAGGGTVRLKSARTFKIGTNCGSSMCIRVEVQPV